VETVKRREAKGTMRSTREITRRTASMLILSATACQVHAGAKVNGEVDVHASAEGGANAGTATSKPVLELDVEFNFDKATLTRTDLAQLSKRETLDALCKALARHKQLVVEGHADSRGPAAHNLELTTQRAEQVRQTFLANKVCHIDPSKLVSVGRGEKEPRRCHEPPECDGKDHGPASCEPCWKQNRMTIVAIADETPASLAPASGCSRVLVLGEERGSRMCE
jgi:outer membrane protein OmpA-like peptidoglycan-associated protein